MPTLKRRDRLERSLFQEGVLTFSSRVNTTALPLDDDELFFTHAASPPARHAFLFGAMSRCHEAQHGVPLSPASSTKSKEDGDTSKMQPRVVIVRANKLSWHRIA